MTVRPSPLFDPLATLPDPLVALAGLVTLLGDPRFLFALLAVGYWRAPPVAADPRRAFAALVALGLASAGLTLALKSVVALPRPPGAAEPGLGFPSGHALGAGAVYGGAARLFDRPDRRTRRLAAGSLVAAVALSRVVLGVHYLVDVLVGAVLGLALARGLDPDYPRRVALAAAGLGLFGLALVLSRPGERAGEAALVAGGAVASALAPQAAGLPRSGVVAVAVAVAGVGALAAAFAFSLGARVLTGGLLVYAVLALPGVVEKNERG